MNKKEVTEFFDGLADSWDADMVKIQSKIDAILDAADVTEGKSVLDVACGTGVLIPDYINRKVRKCVAVDISSKMIENAKKKFGRYEFVEFLCADAENPDFSDKFDCIVIYNAFPHFVNRTLLFKNLSDSLKSDGRITVAHGMSRESLLKHHSGRAKSISTVLPETEEMAELMKPYFDVDLKISTDEIYIVSAVKRRRNMTAFNEEFEKYKAEVRERWGGTDAYNEHAEKTKNYSKDKWNNLADAMNDIMAEFAVCMKNGGKPDSYEAQNLVKKLQNHITDNYYQCTNEILAGLGQMYVADERFRNNIDKHAEGTAEFIREATDFFCANQKCTVITETD